MTKYPKLFKLLREPLLHFLFLGAGIFFFYAQFYASQENSEQKIIITKAKIETLANAFIKAKGRAPTADEMQKQLEYSIREQVLYREAIAMGLDKEDTIIQRRLAQKVKYLFNDLSIIDKASDKQLETFIQEHPSKFIKPAMISFSQIYFDPKEHNDSLNKNAQSLVEKLRKGTIKNSISLGDRSLLPYEFNNERKSDIISMFGNAFMTQAFSASNHKWEGPFSSAYGLHLIYIHKKTEAQLPKLAKIRAKVQREWISMKQYEANEIFYQSMYKNYKIIIDDEVLKDANISRLK